VGSPPARTTAPGGELSWVEEFMMIACYLRMSCVVALLAAGIVAATGGPAVASCVPPPVTSSHAFTGTVVLTVAEGRITYVVTDGGRVVEVRGTPDPSVVTSVDRTYRVGWRYEFHPLNASSPYEDNACTATHELGPVVPGELDDLLRPLLGLAPGGARS
jgi:hypothetical protein